MLNWLKTNTENARNRLVAEASKFKNRSFLEAVMGGCALVAAADGNVSNEEKEKMVGFIRRAQELKHFDMKEAVGMFTKFVEEIEFDRILGKATILQVIGRISNNTEQSKLLVRVVCAIGAADGDFDKDEQAVAAEICRELGLQPGEFEL